MTWGCLAWTFSFNLPHPRPRVLGSCPLQVRTSRFRGDVIGPGSQSQTVWSWDLPGCPAPGPQAPPSQLQPELGTAALGIPSRHTYMSGLQHSSSSAASPDCPERA